MKIEQIVGRNIEKHFIASGLNITNFSKKISVTNGKYTKRIMDGEISINIGKLSKIAKALDVGIFDLLEGADNPDLIDFEVEEKPKKKSELTKAEKKTLWDRLVSLTAIEGAWERNEQTKQEVYQIRKLLGWRNPPQSELTVKQKQIIHALKKGLNNQEASEKLGCTSEYVASINRQFKNGVYKDYLSKLYQVEVNVLELYSNGLDTQEIAFKLNISEDDVKNALEELEGLA